MEQEGVRSEQRYNQIFNNSHIGRLTIMMLMGSSGSGSLNSVDKESIGSSGFVAITFFKKSSDSKRERWERPRVTFELGVEHNDGD
jgi:hypothetical protein